MDNFEMRDFIERLHEYLQCITLLIIKPISYLHLNQTKDKYDSKEVLKSENF